MDRLRFERRFLPCEGSILAIRLSAQFYKKRENTLLKSFCFLLFNPKNDKDIRKVIYQKTSYSTDILFKSYLIIHKKL